MLWQNVLGIGKKITGSNDEKIVDNVKDSNRLPNECFQIYYFQRSRNGCWSCMRLSHVDDTDIDILEIKDIRGPRSGFKPGFPSF